MIFLNGEKVNIEKFPNGECLIKSEALKIVEGINEVKVKFEGDYDITHLMFLKGHLDSLRKKASLVIPYMPYSRMDRTEGMTVFTLKVLGNIINAMDFEEVTVYEPHSEVTLAILDRVKSIDMTKNLAIDLYEKIKDENVYFVFPDAGAAKRYGKQIQYENTLVCNKERDFKTGHIKKLDVIGEVKEKGFTAIIVDDLCSKGGTFMMTGKKLREMGAEKIYLVVTHCEDSIFLGEVLNTDVIDEIYTTNSILSKCHEKIKIFEI
ncbi:MAG: ribose-phosphate pyrophosphokinase [Clostridium sp.]